VPHRVEDLPLAIHLLPEKSGGEASPHERSRRTGEPEAALLRESPLQVASSPHDRPVPASGHRPLVAQTSQLRRATWLQPASRQSPTGHAPAPRTPQSATDCVEANGYPLGPGPWSREADIRRADSSQDSVTIRQIAASFRFIVLRLTAPIRAGFSLHELRTPRRRLCWGLQEALTRPCRPHPRPPLPRAGEGTRGELYYY
jgi:hypothetical protein